MNRHAPSRYGAVAQAFHWVTAVFVLVAFIYGAYCGAWWTGDRIPSSFP